MPKEIARKILSVTVSVIARRGQIVLEGQVEFFENDQQIDKSIPFKRILKENFQEFSKEDLSHFEKFKPHLIIKLNNTIHNLFFEQDVKNRLKKDVKLIFNLFNPIIITDGLNGEVTELITDIVHEYNSISEEQRIFCIGLTEWNSNFKLDKSFIKYDISRETLLNCYQDFYVFHDALSKETLTDFQSHIVQEIKRLYGNNIPVVRFVIGTNRETLQTIGAALNNKEPVILFENTCKFGLELLQNCVYKSRNIEDYNLSNDMTSTLRKIEQNSDFLLMYHFDEDLRIKSIFDLIYRVSFAIINNFQRVSLFLESDIDYLCHNDQFLSMINRTKPKLLISFSHLSRDLDYYDHFFAIFKHIFLPLDPWILESNLDKSNLYLVDKLSLDNAFCEFDTSAVICIDSSRNCLRYFHHEFVTGPDVIALKNVQEVRNSIDMIDPLEKVPKVYFLTKGDENDIKDVLLRLEKNETIIVFPGLDGAAKLISQFCFDQQTNLKSREEDLDKEFWLNRIKETFSSLGNNDEKVNECYSNLKRILSKKEYLVDFNESYSIIQLKDSLYNHFFMNDIETTERKLNLCLLFETVDFIKDREQAKNYIRATSNEEKQKKLLLYSLIGNNSLIVEEYLTSGYFYKLITSCDDIVKLYKMMSRKKSSHSFLLKNFTNEISSTEFQGQQFLKQDLKRLYTKYIIDRNQFLNFERCVIFNHLDIPLAIFNWAILYNHQDIAYVLWREGKKSVVMLGLLSKGILLSLSTTARKHHEINMADNLKYWSDIWEKRSYGTLEQVYKTSRETAHNLLAIPKLQWGTQSVLDLSKATNSKFFISNPACQTLLSEMWIGKIHYDNSTFKILLTLLLCLLLPVFSPIFVKYLLSFKGIEQDGSRLKRCCFNNSKLLLFFYAPIVKFWLRMITNLIFIGCFTCFVLTDLHPWTEKSRPSILEILTTIWVFSLILEEIYQVLTMKMEYFKDSWNILDCSSYFMFTLAFILRISLPLERFSWVRNFFCLSLGCFYIGLLQICYVSEVTGPKLIMVQKMLKNLFQFMVILTIFMLSYGVVSQGLRHPNASLDWNLLKNIIYKPYWQMYGELFLDDIEGNNQDCNNSCPEKSWLALILFAIYMVIVNILLLNLLIAMFSSTYEKVESESEIIYKYQRFELINEYIRKPFLPPPLNVIHLLWYCCTIRCPDCRSSRGIELEQTFLLDEREAMLMYLKNENEKTDN
ncbi:DgyrCDS14416 [Dimorphilus gyrociliatus]|uniref:DgyrCDS14416 n=1 Tax=Dimorphilus gyrociliatus TaxID=2664684 RepID=A0A7I8WDI7_9ANNE|nr:DgyrCDS14416 [Dimorphilus gyrociliatus]